MVNLHDALLSAAEDLGLGGILTGEDDLLFAADDYKEPINEDGSFDEDGNLIHALQKDSVQEPMRIAIVEYGPNMGKSTLINSLIMQDRLLTGPEAGITRDAIEVPSNGMAGLRYRLVDTAGMRRDVTPRR